MVTEVVCLRGSTGEGGWSVAWKDSSGGGGGGASVVVWGWRGRCGSVLEGRLRQLSGRGKTQRLSMSEVNRL